MCFGLWGAGFGQERGREALGLDSCDLGSPVTLAWPGSQQAALELTLGVCFRSLDHGEETWPFLGVGSQSKPLQAGGWIAIPMGTCCGVQREVAAAWRRYFPYKLEPLFPNCRLFQCKVDLLLTERSRQLIEGADLSSWAEQLSLCHGVSLGSASPQSILLFLKLQGRCCCP